MKFTYEILPQKRFIFLRYTGTFTLPELITAAESLWSDPRYSPSFKGLVDLSSGRVNASIGDLRGIIEFVLRSEKTSTARWAAVASSPLATAYSMIYKRAVSRRHLFEVFSTWDAACEFLGVDFPPERAASPAT